MGCVNASCSGCYGFFGQAIVWRESLNNGTGHLAIAIACRSKALNPRSAGSAATCPEGRGISGQAAEDAGAVTELLGGSAHALEHGKPEVVDGRFALDA